MTRPRVACLLGMTAVFVLWSSTAFAQSATTGAIAGVVRDATGAVLPGVTVEAASPALIEKVRTVVTDDQGNYKIVDLRPGAYVVTFTLTGFSTFRREGIELTSGFTATANAEMKLGSLEETVTVTGASPVVDVQRVAQSKVLTREVIDSIPTGRTIQGFAALTLGASVNSTLTDVGGDKGEAYGTMAIHGGRELDAKLSIDGMRYNNMEGSGRGRFFYINQAGVQEINLETGGMTAEAETGGVSLNVIPKDGGNTFKFHFNTSGTTSSFQGDNLSDEIRARGATTSSPVKMIYDFGAGLGGKIVQDKLWFYTAHRWWGNESYVPLYFNKFGFNTFRYEPDLDKQAFSKGNQRDNTIRLTWQASARNKLTGQYSRQSSCQCFQGIGTNARTPEATLDWKYRPVSLTQITWSFPMTSKLLIDAGASIVQSWVSADPIEGVAATSMPIFDTALGLTYNAPPGGTSNNLAGVGNVQEDYGQHNERFGVSYVTGSHALKFGAQTQHGRAFFDRVYVNTDVSYTFRAGVPLSLTQWATPATALQTQKLNLGLFAQDQWTLRRLTLNLGLRYDYLNSYVPAQTRPATRFVPAIEIARIDDVPNWKDLSPRMGATYDLFGTGKTAVKGYLSRYVAAHSTDIATAVNPAAGAIGLFATRTWTDANGNFAPDCDLFVNAANGECGTLDSRTFGRNVLTTRFGEDVRTGFGTRDYTWQGSIGLQHELRPNVGVNATYFRTWFGNFTLTDNLAVQPSDYSPFCITAPTDARLGDVSGTQQCGLYDINPVAFGQIDGLVTQADNYGKQTEHYDGFDFGFNARYGKGGVVQGGVGLGRTITDNCFVVDSPQQTRDGFCHVNRRWGAGTQVKMAVSYPLAFGLQASANLQNLPGFPKLARYVATNAEIAPSLGRNLAAGPNATVTVDLIPPNTQYEDRYTQLDLRLTKVFRIGRSRFQGWADLYNTLNAATVLSSIPTYGPTWLRPTSLLGARLFKVGGQFDF